ncbi:hypothetical protein [Sphingomonas sp. VNH70]|uniref:hypothetical protein n=1 Tax=Sphingomonas silueang TaxID=3156617 RepID=UPI0032B33026
MLDRAIEKALIAWPKGRDLDNVDLAFLGRAKGDRHDLKMLVRMEAAGLVQRLGRTPCRCFIACRLTPRGKQIAHELGGADHG